MNITTLCIPYKKITVLKASFHHQNYSFLLPSHKLARKAILVELRTPMAAVVLSPVSLQGETKPCRNSWALAALQVLGAPYCSVRLLSLDVQEVTVGMPC